MSKENLTPETPDVPVSKPKKKKKKGSGTLGRVIRRFFLSLFTVVLLVFAALVLVMNMIFNGPSPAAQKVLTMALIEASATKWVPALFIGQEAVDEITSVVSAPPMEETSSVANIVINKGSALTATTDEWKNYPDGIRIEKVPGDTYNAHVMIIRDPSKVYMATSTDDFYSSVEGKRINVAIEDEGAIAAINAGAFNDDGTGSSRNGSTPLGLVYSEDECVWTSGRQPGTFEGFAGFNQDDVLVVSQKNLTKAEAEEMGIRDGCCFGPVLLMNGEPNMEAYNSNSGWNPRTAIGQRADGAVIFVCVEGRQVSSPGATYADITDIMVEYGAINACNMDGGSSTVMMYKDVNNVLDVPEEREFGNGYKMVNNYSLLQSQPRRMPNYWMVRAAD